MSDKKFFLSISIITIILLILAATLLKIGISKYGLEEFFNKFFGVLEIGLV